MKPVISNEEFKRRVLQTQQKMKEANLDLLLCFANEAEPQFVRYYSNYWPSFEFAGVLIAQEGEPVLIIGPESGTYASGTSKIKKIRKLLAFRESSNPEYPGIKLDSFRSILNDDFGLQSVSRAGVAGYGLITYQIFREFEKACGEFGAGAIVNADEIVSSLRMIKSEDELACMKEAYRIASEAMKAVIEKIAVGMTENQVKGIALAKIFAEGGEGESYPFWILTGKGSNQAISRCRNKVIQAGDLVQVQVAARYEGYASTIGRPIYMGKADDGMKKFIEAGYLVQKEILKIAKPGVPAKKISDKHYEVLKELGFDQYILYGPVHGTGLMEGESPWIESVSDYNLQENMTFCTCLYLGDDEKSIGLRVEDGFVITKEGAVLLSDVQSGLIEK